MRTPKSSEFGCRVVVAAVWLGLAPACDGSDPAPTTPTTQTTAATTTDSGGGDGDATAATEDGESGQDTAADGTAATDADGPGDSEAETAAQGACDPPSIPFSEQASVSMDPAAGTCAVAEGMGADPQLLFDVRDTGLIDLTAVGFSIGSASSGTYIDAMHVVAISPEFPVTVEGTLDGGTAVTIDFEILQTGPVLFAEVSFG